jgi:RHH-type proline utilization regulon transcriptional repressor/proline dehydrogenase/delta 1-pyrroline-5-carboxylate dehydrogenase
VLGVMKARDLDEAIALVNQTGYGLTSGIETLDDREREEWLGRVRAGNLYVNRGTTGAIVLRQPFGGMGKSAFGPGIKAGGPHYLTQLLDFRATGSPRRSEGASDPDLAALHARLSAARAGAVDPDAGRLPADTVSEIIEAIESYDLAIREEFGVTHDHFRLVGQDNLRRYLPVADLRIRIHPDDSAFDLFARVCAAKTVGCRSTVSTPHDFSSPALDVLERLTEPWGAQVEFLEESDEELSATIAAGGTERVRYAAPERIPEAVFRAVGDTGVYLARAPVLAAGRIELLWYMREQSISIDYHRYGNLVTRAEEERAEVR